MTSRTWRVGESSDAAFGVLFVLPYLSLSPIVF
jgi:hypothetical protein